ncbi:MAG TPA: protein kinase [Candidatus Polarisedimenticolia bacterium]|nr:protein kinase [Candidatus Polarisedimenticolia bacterium]
MQDPASLVGQTVSHYRILAKVGSGGMGVVYKAQDVRLGRFVALKFLPEEFAPGEVARERFRREARAVSALNHPHICTLHDIGEHDTRPFLVMELLEGETLRQRMKRGRALPTDEILDLGAQMADALEAAHRKGVFHRDLKPANVFLTEHGGVKILDFGVAKLDPARPRFPAGLSATETPTATAVEEDDLTGPGVAVGTVAYMSPEQARAEEVDGRSDLFSLGSVLYEMATGRLAFAGPTPAVIFHAILRRAPRPARALNPALPIRLEEIIGKALEKERDLRYQTAAELRGDLKRLKRDTDSGQAAATGPGPRGGVAFLSRTAIAMTGVGVALAAFSLWTWMRGPAVHPQASAAELKQRQLTANPPENPVDVTTLSPDGKLLAYRDRKGFHVRVVDTGETNPLPLPEDLRKGMGGAAWFPDGTRLLITSEEPPTAGIWTVSPFGGKPLKLRDDGEVRGTPTVSPDGSHIAFRRGGNVGREIWVMDEDGSNALRIAAATDEVFSGLQWSPDSRRVAYLKHYGKSETIIESRPAAGGEATEILTVPGSIWSLCWVADGRLVYSEQEKAHSGTLDTPNGEVWELGLDPSTGRPSAVPRRLVQWPGFSIDSLSASRDGRRLAALTAQSATDVYIGDLEENGLRMSPLRRLTLDDREDRVSGWTLDSRAVLFTSDRNGTWDIFRQGLDQEDAEFIAGGPGIERHPGSSPDGRWILYVSRPAKCQGDLPPVYVMRIPVTGGSPERVAEAGPCGLNVFFGCPWVPGRPCTLVRSDENHNLVFDLDPVQGIGKERLRLEKKPFYWDSSPDGRQLAVVWFDQKDRIQVFDLDGGARREIVLKTPGLGLFASKWSADGRGFLALANQSYETLLVRIDPDGTSRILYRAPRFQYQGEPIVSPDGRHVALNVGTTSSNAWLLEGF